MTIHNEKDIIILENQWISRRLSLKDGPETTGFHVRPHGTRGATDWHTLMFNRQSFPYEAAVSLDGREYQAGPRAPKPGFAKEGAFNVVESRIENWSLGTRLVLLCRPRRDDVPDVLLTLRYDIADNLPLLVRSMSVENTGQKDVRLDNMVVDPLPHSKYDYAREIFTFSDYYEQYGSIRLPDLYYRGWIRHQFPTDMNLVLHPGQAAESFRLFEYTAPNTQNERAVVHHRVFKALAPWTRHQPIQQTCNTAKTIEDLRRVIDTAQNLGFEMIHLFVNQLFTNCGDYVFRPDLFPKGDDDVKALLDYAHKRSIKLLPYTGLTIAWEKTSWCESSRVCLDHPDWQYLGPDGIRYQSYSFGNMCYQSGWGDYILEQYRRLLDDIGFDGIHIDGPYHWLPCLASDHKHETPESVYYMNWAWERDFFQDMAKRGAYITVPQDPGALLLGANHRPGGYTEEDYSVIGGMPQVCLTRSFLLDALDMLPATCRWACVNLDPYHGHSIEPGEEHTETYEHGIATCFGLGHSGQIGAGRNLVLGPRTETILKKWIGFFRDHSDTLDGDTIRLVRPDGKHPDALLHLNAGADPCAVLVAFNPGPDHAVLNLTLPLGNAGIEPGGYVRIDGQTDIALDSLGRASISVSLKQFEVKWWDIRAI